MLLPLHSRHGDGAERSERERGGEGEGEGRSRSHVVVAARRVHMAPCPRDMATPPHAPSL